jgi:hypothetical protein
MTSYFAGAAVTKLVAASTAVMDNCVRIVKVCDGRLEITTSFVVVVQYVTAVCYSVKAIELTV